MSKTDISVLLPVYNAAPYLQTALDSLSSQTWGEFEIIAVDDGSSDDSLDILRRHGKKDRRVKIISRKNTGIVGALNDALAAATGQFLARMDADDQADPERFRLQRARLIDDPSLVGVGSAVTFMDPAGNCVETCLRPLDHAEIEQRLLMGDGGAMIHPTLMFPASAIRALGGYRRFCRYFEDLDLCLRLARIGTLANLPESLLRYRIHGESMNFTKDLNRTAIKAAILREAHADRGLSYEGTADSTGDSAHTDSAFHAKQWAVTALQFGSRRVAVGHGLRAVRLDPTNSGSWRALKVALTAPVSLPPFSS